MRISPAGEPDEYLAEIPNDISSNVYWVRIAADRRGHSSPRSALSADFVQGIINPAARTGVSVFCPTARHAFLLGADVPFSVVIKTTAAVPAAKLQVMLRSDRGEFLLCEQQTPVLEPGRHPFHYALSGEATEGLRPGKYALVATVGALRSNEWEIQVVQPRNRAGAPHFDDGWLAANIDLGASYANVPESIREANAKRALLQRNTRSRARRGANLQIVDWSSQSRHTSYQGRDSSSEVAQAEMLLRNELALPAHEVYYYQNHWESVCEVLTRYGMDHFTSTPCFISQLSLIHSLDDQVNAKMRQHQLIAQIGRKFEGFTGMNPMFMSTSPLGNSEVVDPTRHMKLVNMRKNFEAKHGFPEPTFAKTIPYIRSILAGRAPDDPKAGARWEAWMTMINNLMYDYYANLRRSVDPLSSGLLYPNRGPSWVGDTESGTYPGLANANQSPLPVLTGHGDYGHWFIWWPTCATKFYRMSGQEVWGVCGAGWGSIYRHHLGMFLMCGARGMGYLRGPKPEADDVTVPWNCDDIDELLEVRNILRAYGPILRRIEHRAPLAVYYSFHQSMYDTASMAGLSTQLSVQSAMMQLAVLGYTYELLTDEMIDAGEIDRFKAVLVPLLYKVLPRHREALEAFAAAGGTVLLGSKSTSVPAGARMIDDDFQELPFASAFWDFNAIADVGHAWVAAQIRQKAPVLRKALQPVREPFALPRGDGIMLQTGRAGDVRYTFVLNFTYPSWMGTGRVTGDPEHSAVDGEANERYLVPINPVIDFPAGWQVYDMFTHQELSRGAAGDGPVSVACDMSFSPFKILVGLPAEIARLRVELPEAVTAGGSFPVSVTPLDGEGKPIGGSVPVEIEVRDAAGETVATVYGVSGPENPPRIGAGIGSPAGTWKVRVKELVGGRSAETTLAVAPPQELPFGRAVREVPSLDVQRRGLVRGFIEARAGDNQTVLIVLDEQQYSSRMPVAKALVEELTVLLGPDLRPVATERFEVEPYFGQIPLILNRHVVWEHRQVFSVGDTLHLSNPGWTEVSSISTGHQILGLAVDEARRRIAVSNYAGELIVFDEKLTKQWEARLPTAARLAFLPDGRLVAGSVRGGVTLFSADGTQRLWERSLKRYAPPEEVDGRWAAVERTPSLTKGAAGEWWERLKRNVELGPDVAKLSGTVRPGAPLEVTAAGEAFGTYLVEWRCGRAQGAVPLSLTIVEDEEPLPDRPETSQQRLSLSCRPTEAETVERAILRLGDRPAKVRVSVECGEGGEAQSAVSIRPLMFPSKNLVRMDTLYRGGLADATYIDPPAKVEMFFNVGEAGAPHTTRHAEPTALVNGRMLEKEPELLKGLWCGSGTTFKKHIHAIIPSYVEIILPSKRVLTHIVLAEDLSLPRGETMTVDAFVESREVRNNVTAYERRQLARGFWYNAVKFRGNDSPYNVFRFEKPIYARKLRVYILSAPTAIPNCRSTPASRLPEKTASSTISATGSSICFAPLSTSRSRRSTFSLLE